MAELGGFVVGDEFSSYKDFQKHLEEFQRRNYVEFTHRDSRTLEGVGKRTPNITKKANQTLVYYSLVLSCKLGGKKYKSKGAGVRPNQKYDLYISYINCYSNKLLDGLKLALPLCF